MRRLAVSGTNWTRKTSTIMRLKKADKSLLVVSLSPMVADAPHPMIQDQTLAGSKWITKEVSTRLQASSDKDGIEIFDRSPLDMLAFTMYAERNGGKRDIKLLSKIMMLSATFDVIYLLRPQEEWPHPVKPTRDKRNFALLMDFFLIEASAMLGDRVQELPWDEEVRYTAISQRIRQMKKVSKRGS